MRFWMLLLPLLPMAALAACDRQSQDQEQAKPSAPAPEAGKVDLARRGEEAPAMPFVGPEGGPATLTQFRGKPLLVNLWATWCAPCLAEMPTLDALAGREKDRLQLVAISQDMAGKRTVGPYFAKAGFKMLKPYLDKENVLMLALKSETLPTTILYDAKGKEVWRVVGAMDWNGATAKGVLDQGLDAGK